MLRRSRHPPPAGEGQRWGLGLRMGEGPENLKRSGAAVVFYLTFQMTCLQSLAGTGCLLLESRSWASAGSWVHGLRSRQQRRDGEKKTAVGGGGRGGA